MPFPHHSVLSKARRRWGKDVFQRLFVRTIEQCVAAGLVAGDKLHVDGSLSAANASKDSAVRSSPGWIAAYAAAGEAAEKKLSDPADRPCFRAVNDTASSSTDPDAGLARKGGQGSHPAYHHHRVVDDAQGVVTAVETTSGSIAENKKLMDVLVQHEQNTGCVARTAVADHKYGTAENFVACHQKGIVTPLGDAKAKAGQVAGISRRTPSGMTSKRISLRVRLDRSCGDGVSSSGNASGNMAQPKESVAVARCGRNARAQKLGGRLAGMSTPRFWKSVARHRTAPPAKTTGTGGNI